KLTSDQRSAIVAVMNDFAAKLRSVLADRSTNPKDSAKLAELTNERDEKVLALLTPEQRKTWQEMLGPPAPKIAGAGGITVGSSNAAVLYERLFDRYDTDGSGTLSESEMPDLIKTRLTDSGATLKFPVSKEEFVKAYSAYLERGQRGRQ